MSSRCTKITLMYAGGMVDIRGNFVYYIDESNNKVARVTNVLEFRHTTISPEFDIVISTDPLELSVEDFKIRSRGKKSVNKFRVTGTEHIDKPVTEKEKSIRNLAVERIFKRSSSFFGKDEKQLRNEYEAKVQSVMDKIGSETFQREFSDLVNQNRAKSFSNILAFLSQSESLETKAIKLANDYARNNNKSEIISKMAIVSGQKVPYELEVDWSKQDSISEHAYVRWLERIEGVLDQDLFNRAVYASFASLSRGGSNSVASEICKDFNERCALLGINKSMGSEIRSAITNYLRSPELEFSNRKSNTTSSTVDRFNAFVKDGDRTLEFTLFPYEIKKKGEGRPVLKVKVLSVLDREYSKTSGDILKIEKIKLPDSQLPEIIVKEVTNCKNRAEKYIASILK